VLGRDALVAEVLAQLVDAVDSPHHGALEVQLGRDPQVEIAIERVVMCDERPGEGAAVERLEHRGLHLHEAAGVEPLANRRHDLGALQEQVANLRVGDQIQLAVPVANLHVLEAVVLVRRRAQALRQKHPVLDAQRQLAPLGCEHGSLGADDVAEVDAHQGLESVRSKDVLASVQLDPRRAVDQVEERRPAMPAARGDAPRHPVAIVGLLTGAETLVGLSHGPDLRPPLEGVREGLEPGFAKPRELLAPLGDHV
jgi:hypothetical protein